MINHIDTVQTPLSEDLFFLGRLISSHPPHPFLNKQELLLNAVALYMTTGHPDGVIATFFHETSFTIYLAKSGPLSHDDAERATSFFSCLKVATGFKSLLPYLARYSVENVEKRVRNLSHSLKDLLPWVSDVVLQHEENAALESLESLLKSPFTFLDTAESHNTFTNIIAASKNILALFSPFSCALASLYGIEEPLSRFKRRLGKIVQYLDINQVIRFVQRNSSKIIFFWVPDTTRGQISVNLGTLKDRHLDGFLESATANLFPAQRAKSRELMAVALTYPDQTVEVTLFVHPEIHLIMYLTDVVGVQNQYPPDTRLCIGSSKNICGCCKQWIDAFNNCMTVKWMTTFHNDGMYCNWKIPDPDLVQHIQAAVCQGNDAVVERVKQRMEEVFSVELDCFWDRLFA
ncbi:hypothetical protein C0989_011299 [Termitomyces sp. Mn162]|nr:hypothetical protein C0989_011299 [Termitomyces sp. Mn162]